MVRAKVIVCAESEKSALLLTHVDKREHYFYFTLGGSLFCVLPGLRCVGHDALFFAEAHYASELEALVSDVCPPVVVTGITSFNGLATLFFLREIL